MICENDYNPSSDLVDKNLFNNLSTTYIPLNDSRLNSPIVVQNETHSSSNTQKFIDDYNFQETNEIKAFNVLFYVEENELRLDPHKGNKTSYSNRKRKPKKNQSSSSSMLLHERSNRLQAKRNR
ncbi:unnamed protein product, partial [Rotaria sp. Silwood2]